MLIPPDLTILTVSLGAGTVSGHRMIDVITGGGQRPGQQDLSVGSCACTSAATASSPAAQAGNHSVHVT